MKLSYQKIYLKIYKNKPAITCSKLTTETLEQGLKYAQT